ncbi:MAG: glucose-1-phosphate adenylyltransferase [Bacilli bacterium]|nr:glucose-1-phosphate adenylyltransferase [Erysipelotrichaceae bacterium]MDY5669533.1 glucose-1-phosphate adenylyltransferase [Bacilli bacterium]
MAEKMVAMILAGGKGTRLEALTKKVAKPAVSFGAKYRIIDFPLSNCANSKIHTVGVLMQYESVALDQYVGNGSNWGLNGVRSHTATLTPRQTEEGLSWFKGTADAIYCNIDFLDSCDPEYVLILSGDHIYCTSYEEMLDVHEENNADCTIAVYRVPLEEASRFGILVTNENKQIVEFQEKPAHPTSDLASMGIYIFNYKTLRKYLIEDAKNEKSSHDFGKDIIPAMLNSGKKMMAYEYKGYWKDVGTIASLHQANMDLLKEGTTIEEISSTNRLYSEDTNSHPQYIGANSDVRNSLINQGAIVLGDAIHSVISNEVLIGPGSHVENSVVMTGAKIGKNAKVYNAVVAPGSIVGEGETVGALDGDVVLYAKKVVKSHE